MITLDDLAESLRCKTPSINHVIGFCSVKNIDGVGIITGIDGSYVKCQVSGVDYKQEKWDSLSNVEIKVLAEVVLSKFETGNEKIVLIAPPASRSSQEEMHNILIGKVIM